MRVNVTITRLYINIMTQKKEDNMILDLIDKILDPKEKREQLEKYLYLSQNENKVKNLKEDDSLNIVIQRIKNNQFKN